MQNARFATALRGYDRDQVDRYMNRVNQMLAELQITAAPESAIKHALERVAWENKSVIREAQKEAEEITRQSRSRADDRIHEVTKEAQDLRAAAAQEAEQLREAAAQEASGTLAGAETRIRTLQAHVEKMQAMRDRAVEELVELSRILDELLERNGANGDAASPPARAEAKDAGLGAG